MRGYSDTSDDTDYDSATLYMSSSSDMLIRRLVG